MVIYRNASDGLNQKGQILQKDLEFTLQLASNGYVSPLFAMEVLMSDHIPTAFTGLTKL